MISAPEGLKQLDSLAADGVGHHYLERITAADRDQRERDPGVAGGRLKNRLPRPERAVGLCLLNHELRNPVLH